MDATLQKFLCISLCVNGFQMSVSCSILHLVIIRYYSHSYFPKQANCWRWSTPVWLSRPLPILSRLVVKGLLSHPESWTQPSHDCWLGWDVRPWWQCSFLSFLGWPRQAVLLSNLPRAASEGLLGCASLVGIITFLPGLSCPGCRLLPSGVGGVSAGPAPRTGTASPSAATCVRLLGVWEP